MLKVFNNTQLHNPTSNVGAKSRKPCLLVGASMSGPYIFELNVPSVVIMKSRKRLRVTNTHCKRVVAFRRFDVIWCLTLAISAVTIQTCGLFNIVTRKNINAVQA